MCNLQFYKIINCVTPQNQAEGDIYKASENLAFNQ